MLRAQALTFLCFIHMPVAFGNTGQIHKAKPQGCGLASLRVLTCRPLQSAFGCRRGKTCASRAVRDGLGSPHRMAAKTQSVGHVPAGVTGHTEADTGTEPDPPEGTEGGQGLGLSCSTSDHFFFVYQVSLQDEMNLY